MKFHNMNELQHHFVVTVPDAGADRILREMVGHEMATKLEKSRAKGRHGWHTAGCSSDELLSMLIAHIPKGDMIDVINFAAMIHARGLLFGDVPNFSGVKEPANEG